MPRLVRTAAEPLNFGTRPPAWRPRAWVLAWALGLGMPLAVLAQATKPAKPASPRTPASQPAAQPAPAASGAASAAPEPPAAPSVSALDGPLFYQLFVGELEAQAGHLDSAYEVILDAARRTRDADLFQRAVELAIRGRSADRALAATRAWRSAAPESAEPLRIQIQVLVATNQPDELADLLRSLVQMTPAAERSALISGIPRFLGNLPDKAKTLALTEQALSPFVNADKTRAAARTTLGFLSMAAGKNDAALALARRGLADDPSASGPMLLAIELVPSTPAADALVQKALARDDTPAPVRLAYVRALEQAQRIGEAIAPLQAVLAKEPNNAAAWLTLGALQVELRDSRQGIESLNRFLALPPSEPTPNTGATPAASEADSEENTGAEAPVKPGSADNTRLKDTAAKLMAQAFEQLGDDPMVIQWLGKLSPAGKDLGSLVREAGVLARKGQLDEARRLVRDAELPENPEPGNRLLAEVQVLREQKQWQAAYELLLEGMRRQPDDATVIYELAMVAERMGRFEDMELLIKRVISLKADDAHAFNALGYSLAERKQRLDEAATLVDRAVALAPRDPFIIDSQGWVAYRQGKNADALRLLRQAYRARPHVEVAAHLAEVLWVNGQRDEARQILRTARSREAGNEVLVEVITRLGVNL